MTIISFSMNPFQKCCELQRKCFQHPKILHLLKTTPFFFAKQIGFSYSFLYPLYCKVFTPGVSQRGTMFKSGNHQYYSTSVSWNQFHLTAGRLFPYPLTKFSYSLYLICLSIVQDAIFTGLLVISINTSSFGLLREHQRISCEK